MSRPPWWKPWARRRWDNAQGIVKLLRRCPTVAEDVEALRAAHKAALPSIEELAERLDEIRRAGL